MRKLLEFPAGRRAKWLVLVVMLLIGGALGAQGSKLEQAQKNDPSSFLPGSSESVKALDLEKKFKSGTVTPAVVVFRRATGLTPADRARIQGAAAKLTRLHEAHPRQVLPVSPAVPSRDGKASLIAVPIHAGGDSDVLQDRVKDVSDAAGDSGGGLDVKVTGPAGFSRDAIKVFGSIDTTLLAATAGLVFLLLVIIYRSPIFWFFPLFSVAMAESASRGLGYLLAEAGLTINGQTAGILVVLVFGAGTDYALLLVARYREELRHHEDKHDAMRIALRRAGPAIVASAATVVLALLCLAVADLNATAGLGPVGAIGIALAATFMLTLLPALLLVAGRRAFWPFIPRYGSESSDETHGVWRRIGDRIARAPRRVWAGALGVLVFFALGLVWLNNDLTTGNGFRGEVASVQGQKLLAESYPGGTTAPSTVIVPEGSRTTAAQAALRDVPGVVAVSRAEQGAGGARFTITLASDPYSDRSFNLIPKLRRTVKQAAGESAVLGGPTAEEHDLRVAAARDNRVIIPLVLIVVLVILMLVLRAVVAPLLLIGTVIVSYLAALGLSSFLFTQVLDYPGLDPGLPLFAFTFLVALGVDYNIFLMVRVREETREHGAHEGMLRGLAVTGNVITSAGIVLAGTFSFLAILPLYALTEIGITIVIGVLLDTFVVRSIVVPALGLDLGERIWWPSALARHRSLA
jgi:RND superfamily putative drug exporter